MPDANDMDLVREFARDNSEAAFTELVRRHINLVYSVARRCTGNDGDAHDVTQAVFIILARKAAGLREKTLLAGWLYETTRFTAARLLRTNARRHAREQEVYMQSTLNDLSRHSAATAEAAEIWTQLSPHLEAAMSKLAERDRALLVLRFYENKSGPEAAALLGIREEAAHKRATRAIEKLRKFFAQRGVTLTATAIAGAVSGNSVQAAPMALVKAISAIAGAKGAAATTSTLTLVKGALKLMAWTKTQTAIVVSVVVLLATGTTTITIKEIQEYRTYPWQLPNFNPKTDNIDIIGPAILAQTTPQVRIVRSKRAQSVTGFGEGDSVDWINGQLTLHTNQYKNIGIGVTLADIVKTAYHSDDRRTVFATELPNGRYDFIANLAHGSLQALQELIKHKFGIVGKSELRETDVFVLKLSNPDAHAFLPATSLMRSMNITNIDPVELFLGTSRGDEHFNQTIENFMEQTSLEDTFQLPIVDETGLTNHYDFIFKNPTAGIWPRSWNNNPDARKQALTDALLNQLGLELVPTNMPIEMLVVEKVK